MLVVVGQFDCKLLELASTVMQKCSEY